MGEELPGVLENDKSYIFETSIEGLIGCEV